jgi:hypothetical protein
MAEAQGLSKDTIHRIWKQHNLKPHLIETFKLSRDKRFIEKLHDVVGLYLNPPDKALVLCVDEKSQIQALDRTQPLLPLRPGIPARQTHDYKRNGTTTLFAALNTASRAILAETPSPLPLAFHSHFQLLAEHGGALVPRDYRQAHPTRLLPERPGFDRRYNINQYIQTHNQNPKVFVWSASVERIMGKIAKCKEALETLH